MNDPENVLLNLLKGQLPGISDPGEIERIAQAVGAMVGLSPEKVHSVVERLMAVSPAPEATPEAKPLDRPRLMVDWGVEPKIGWETCPEFHLICPAQYRGTPVVEVTVDHRLDHDRTSSRPPVHPEEPGYWTFHVPFGLTTQGANCRPGHYLVQLAVAFPEAPPPAPRYFLCKIRLKVLDPSENIGRTLEIDGDGQSILNLHGSDLSSFSRVVLKGGDRAVVNIQEPLGFLPGGKKAGERESQAAPACKFEYALKVDETRQRQTPSISPAFTRLQPTDSAMLVLPGGQKVLLLARRTTKLGRSRANHIITRFLPQSPENEQRSERISREHLSFELTEQGLLATDQDSSGGTDISHEPLKGSKLLTVANAVKELEIRLGIARGPDSAFCMSLKLFGEPAEFLSQPELAYCDALGIQLPRLWRLAQASQIDALRLRRVSNLREEQYVVIYRQALLGSSADCAIRLADPLLGARHAKILHLADGFWLENLSDPERCQVDGYQVPRRELVPLAFGMQLSLAGTAVAFEEYRQSHL